MGVLTPSRVAVESQVSGLGADLAALNTSLALKAPLASPTLSGILALSAAASKIVPGATSLSLSDHTGAFDNVLISDAGAVTVRAGLTVTGGPIMLGADTILVRDAANTLAMRNGGTLAVPVPQRLSLYNWTDGTNYERVFAGWVGNSAYLGIENTGTGVATRDLRIAAGGWLYFQTGGATRWNMTPHILAGTDNTYDIGASAANRPRNLYVAGNVQLGGHLQTAAGTDLYLEVAGTGRWGFNNTSGHLYAVTDNAVDIGFPGANRPRNLYLAGDAAIGGNVGFYGHAAAAKPTVAGSKAANAALASLMTALAGLGLLTDSTT